MLEIDWLIKAFIRFTMNFYHYDPIDVVEDTKDDSFRAMGIALSSGIHSRRGWRNLQLRGSFCFIYFVLFRIRIYLTT